MNVNAAAEPHVNSLYTELSILSNGDVRTYYFYWEHALRLITLKKVAAIFGVGHSTAMQNQVWFNREIFSRIMTTISAAFGYRIATRTRHGSILITGDDLISFGPVYVRGRMMLIFSVFLHNEYQL